MTFRFVGQVVKAGDPKFGRIEVAIARGPTKHEADTTVVYVSKYESGQLGERSIGMTVDDARAVALLLVAAADSA